MLLHKSHLGPSSQISPYRLQIARCTGSRCWGRTCRDRQTRHAVRNHRGTVKSHCQPHCTEEILEESHNNQALPPCPSQPIPGFVQEHKYILITAREAGEIDGGCNEGEPAKLAIERTQNSLQAVPNTSLESFQKQVEHIQKEWGGLAKSIRSEPQGDQLPASAASSSVPAVQRAINRLQAEGESWEALLNKHRSKAKELERKVEQGQERGVSLDSTSVAQSSQYHFIQSKPDYNGLLSRQQPMLHTMAMIMDTQCKMVRELLSIKKQSQLMVKETSGRLAAESGFQDLSPDLIRNLMAAPLSAATT
ncbi:hypothetical protein L3Q82_014090 [Scortum barcoo]|uniref:Uncharacterized protein n=1 Tax=Scortum barcoo TaxID=214431 RepID=A0ACB8VXR4_9TELE|nr:hypothetical protein L3Q82_014090 [Scortum barcoo]